MNNKNGQNTVWGRLAAFDKIAPAQELVSFLEKHHFLARLYDERKLQRFWFLARPLAGLCVQVPEESRASTRDFLLAQPEGKELLKPAIHCPSCDSTSVHYPQMTRKNVLPTVVAHGLVALGFLRHECYCEDCHFTWARGSGTRTSKTPLFSNRKRPAGTH